MSIMTPSKRKKKEIQKILYVHTPLLSYRQTEVKVRSAESKKLNNERSKSCHTYHRTH